jgi:hypothetical protein
MKSRYEIGILSPICPKNVAAPQDTKLNSFPGIVESEMGKKFNFCPGGAAEGRSIDPTGTSSGLESQRRENQLGKAWREDPFLSG